MSHPSKAVPMASLTVPASDRLLEIAHRRLASARAMKRLSGREPELLALVDMAGRGEFSQLDAEDALSAHLAERETYIDAMRAYNDEWSRYAASLGGTTPSTTDPLCQVASEITAILEWIERSDARFVEELAVRRRQAGAEIGRADGARAANRAYAPQSNQPRFTDRRG
jgi:hypothetical protein